MTVIGTALSGLQATLARLNASASNIANARTTGAMPPQEKPLREGGTTPPVSGAVSGPAPYQPISVVQAEADGGGVTTTYAPAKPGWVPQQDAASPHADERGMVAAPNIDLTGEVVSQIAARIAAEANIRVIQTDGRMDRSILQLWA